MECFRLCLKKNLEEELGSISCFILLENLGDFVLGSEMGNISLSTWKSIDPWKGLTSSVKGMRVFLMVFVSSKVSSLLRCPLADRLSHI